MHKPTRRYRPFRGEFLEARCLLNAAPVGVADEYVLEKDSMLVADRPLGLESFATDFNDGVLGPHLEGSGFQVGDGQVSRAGSMHANDRAYVRTVDANYLDADFRFEVSVRMSNTLETAIYYVRFGRGEGEGDIGAAEPQDSLFLRMHGPTTATAMSASPTIRIPTWR